MSNKERVKFNERQGESRLCGRGDRFHVDTHCAIMRRPIFEVLCVILLMRESLQGVLYMCDYSILLCVYVWHVCASCVIYCIGVIHVHTLKSCDFPPRPPTSGHMLVWVKSVFFPCVKMCMAHCREQHVACGDLNEVNNLLHPLHLHPLLLHTHS